MGIGSAGFVVWAISMCATDRVAPMSLAVRMIALCAGVACVVLTIARPIAFVFRRKTDWVAVGGRY